MRLRADRCLLAGIFVFAVAGGAAAREADPLAAKLPDGDGKQLVVENCSGACHSSDRIINAHKTPAEWRVTVEQMVSNGAQLFPDEVETVTKYLSDHFAANGAPAAASAKN